MSSFDVVVPRPAGYVHSAAFDEVAIGLIDGLRALGHTVFLAERDHAGRRPIVLGSHLLPPGTRLPSDAILWNLEQVEPGSDWIARVRPLFERHTVWDYSPKNAAAYVSAGLPSPDAIVPVGYVPALSRIQPEPKSIDVLFYGSINARRMAVLEALGDACSEVVVAAPGSSASYGEIRDALIARSRIVLNVHFYEAKVFEIVRVSYLLANRACVVSEGDGTGEEAPFASGIAWAPYEGIVDRCLGLLEDGRERERIAAAGFAAMRARPMAEFLRAVL